MDTRPLDGGKGRERIVFYRLVTVRKEKGKNPDHEPPEKGELQTEKKDQGRKALSL